MRGVHELVVGLHVALAGVVLHHPSDGAAPRVEHGQAATELVGEAEQVHLRAELAMVSLLRLLEAEQVLGESILGLPRRAVDALELGTLLIAPPVRAGDAHELEVAEALGRGHVGASTEVGEGLGVLVRRHHRCTRRSIDLGTTIGDGADDLGLERLSGEQRETFVDRVLRPYERLVLLDDLPHGGFDANQVVIAEVLAIGKLEVVVEAVFDHRADCEVGSRPQAKDRLGEDVRRRVPEHLATRRRRWRQDLDRRPIGKHGAQVRLRPIDSDRQSVLGQPRPDRRGQVRTRRPLVELLRGAIGQSDHHLRTHRILFTGVEQSQANAEQGGAGPDAQAGGGQLVEVGERPRRVEIIVKGGSDRRQARPIIVRTRPAPPLDPGHGIIEVPVVPLPVEPVVMRQQRGAHGGGVCPLEQVVDEDEVAERLRHLGAVQADEADVEPVPDEGPTRHRLALGGLALVVREDEIPSPAVDVEGLAELSQRQG